MSRKMEKSIFPFKALVNLHESLPPPDRSYWQSLEARAQNTRGKKSVLLPWRNVLTGVSGAAAAVLLLLLFVPRPLGLPVAVISGNLVAPAYGDKPIFQSGEEPLVLESRGQTLVLSPGTKLIVEPLGQGTAFHTPGNRYRLDGGGVEIIHSDSSTTFELVTPFGSILPLGTALKALVSPENLLLECTEGRIEFQANDGSVHPLEAGEQLTWPKPPESQTSPGPKGTESTSPLAPAPEAAKNLPEAVRTTPETQEPQLRKRWTQNLGAAVQEAFLSRDQWIFRTAEAFVALDNANGGQKGSWTPRSEISTLAGHNLVDYENGRLRSLSPAGNLNWETGVPPLSLGRLGSGPLGLLAASAEGSLLILDPDSGGIRANLALGAGSYGQPLEWDNIIYVSTLNRKFHAWDGKGGVRLWSVNLPERLVGDRPQIWGSLVLVKDRVGTLWALDRISGQILWSVETGWPPQNGIISLGDTLFLRTNQGTLQVDSQGNSKKWAGGVVLAAARGKSGWITAEEDGVYVTGTGPRELILPVSLESAAAHGRSFVLQGQDRRVSLYEWEE